MTLHQRGRRRLVWDSPKIYANKTKNYRIILKTNQCFPQKNKMWNIWGISCPPRISMWESRVGWERKEASAAAPSASPPPPLGMGWEGKEEEEKGEGGSDFPKRRREAFVCRKKGGSPWEEGEKGIRISGAATERELKREWMEIGERLFDKRKEGIGMWR